MNKNILYINPIFNGIETITYSNGVIKYEVLKIPFLQFAENFPHIITEKFFENHTHEIWVVNGPWPFTQMRIVTLSINSIKFSLPKVILKSTNYFDICRPTVEQMSIIQANANEVLVKKPNSPEFFLKKWDVNPGNYCWFLAENTEIEQPFTSFVSNFDNISTIFDTISPQENISPLYIKPPHITWQK